MLKGGIILDAITDCSIISFDKTGTLTHGTLSCLSIESVEEVSEQDRKRALSVALSLEKNTVHPIAQAVIDFAKSHGVISLPLEGFKNIPGYGLEALLNEGTKKIAVRLGNFDFIQDKLNENQKAFLRRAIAPFQKEGELVSILLLGDQIFFFRFKDTTRKNLLETIQELRNKHKYRLLMLTGDHRESAEKVAKELNISEFYAELKPEDKLDYVTKFSKESGLIMIGDGINDAPALTRATVGMSLGTVGSATAVEAADVVFLHDRLDLLGYLIDKANTTKKVVLQNLVVALFAMLIASTLALFGMVPLWVAVVMHEGGTVLVGLNALRLLRV